MQHVTSFTLFDSYHVGLFTTQTRDFEKIQDGPQCVKRCICVRFAVIFYVERVAVLTMTVYIFSNRKFTI